MIIVAAVVLLALCFWMCTACPVWCRRRQERRRERKAREQREREQAAIAAKANAPKIPFTVKELTGKVIQVTALGGLHTVAEIKQEVAATTGGDAERLRLVLNGEPLEDAELTLASCSIRSGSELNAVAKMDGAEVGVPAERAADLEAVAPSAAGRPGTPPKETRRGSRTPPRIPAAKVRAAVAVKRPRVQARVVSGPSRSPLSDAELELVRARATTPPRPEKAGVDANPFYRP